MLFIYFNLSHFHFREGLLSQRTSPVGWQGRAGRTRAQGSHRTAARRCGIDAGHSPFPRSTLNSRRPTYLSFPRTRPRPLSAKLAREAGARLRRRERPGRLEARSRRGAAAAAAAASPLFGPPSLCSPRTHAETQLLSGVDHLIK